MILPATVALLLVAQTDAAFPDEDFFEMLLWGIAFVFVIIGMFILNRVLRVSIGNRVRSRMREFGMSPDDLEKLRTQGGLTEEELARVRTAMGRRFLEQAKEEQEKRGLPPKAEIALELAEAEVKGELPARKQESKLPATAARPPLQRAPEPPPPPPPPVDGPDFLSPPLKVLLQRSDFELEEMRQAGFLSEEDFALLKRAREQRP